MPSVAITSFSNVLILAIRKIDHNYVKLTRIPHNCGRAKCTIIPLSILDRYRRLYTQATKNYMSRLQTKCMITLQLLYQEDTAVECY